MASMDAQAIYDNFHRHATTTAGLEQAQQTAQDLAAKYQDHALATQQMIDGVRVGWKGDAAEAASQGLAPFAENALNNHQQLNTGQDLVSRQVGSFHTAVAEVRPVPPPPQLQNVVAMVLAGQDPKPMVTQFVQHMAVQQSNVDAYNKYVAASQYNTNNVPSVTTIDSQGAPVSITSPSSSASSVATSGGIPHAGGGAAHTRTAAPSSGGDRSAPAVATGHPVPSVAQVSGGQTTTSSAPPPDTVSPPPSSPAPTSAVTSPSSSASVVGPTGGFSNQPGSGGGSSGSPGSDAFGEGGIGAGGMRPGPGSPLTGGRVPVGAGSCGDGPPGENVPGRSGAAPGIAGTEEEALATERGVPSRGAVSPVTGPVAGRRGGTRDAEHKRRYDYGEDPDELFGRTEKVAPPVFGETPAERERRHADEDGRHRGEH